MSASRAKRLVIISNRLPISLEKQKRTWSIRSSSGGLVTALSPVMRDRGGLWIGWPGTMERVELDKLLVGDKKLPYEVKPVWLTSEERDKFYLGFSNEVLWPLFHALQTVCNFDPEYWTMYRWVNRKFARVARRHIRADDYVWVHDYHLMMVAQELRKSNITAPIGFFLHIPFPPPDIFMKMPWRRSVLEALLEYDFLGFQTMRDRRNFIQCVRQTVKNVNLQGKGSVVTLSLGDRQVRVGNFPISIDFADFAERGATELVQEMAFNIHQRLPNRQLMLGVDRLDYTKGLPYKLDGFRAALVRYPEMRQKISLIQVVVPSRSDIAPYHELKTEIDRLVGEINGEFTISGWVPIHYIFRHLEQPELLSLYRASEIALVTPLEDGMNLVAKEFCATSQEDNSVLVLSEFCGAAVQMKQGAVMVNPYDRDGMAEAIYRAFAMPREERRSRMRRLRRSVQEQDIFWWVNAFLKAGQEESRLAGADNGNSELGDMLYGEGN